MAAVARRDDELLPELRRRAVAEAARVAGAGVASGARVTNGALDQRCRADFWPCEGDTKPLSARNDVLVYQSAPLERDMEVTGRLVVKLWVSSDAPDTDFTAKLIDVYPPNADFPAGVDFNVGDSIVRARYRNSLEKAELMKPGEIYELTIELYPTSLLFQRGHRIRLDISSSNFPRFDINPNTGEPLNRNRRWAVATNTVYHDAQHPSHIELPVIPASGSPSSRTASPLGGSPRNSVALIVAARSASSGVQPASTSNRSSSCRLLPGTMCMLPRSVPARMRTPLRRIIGAKR